MTAVVALVVNGPFGGSGTEAAGAARRVAVAVVEADAVAVAAVVVADAVEAAVTVVAVAVDRWSCGERSWA
jgi:hypothetical protein